MAGQVATSLKAALRREILAARDALTVAARDERSIRITQKVLALEAYRNATCVLAYMSFGSEFNTSALLADVRANGKQLCLPRVNRDTHNLEIHRVENLETELRSGVMGIREPLAGCPRTELNRIDFVLMPGVAFTPNCDRLGYGGGYYDRLITQFARRPPLIAAVFGLQMRDEIPLTTFDQRVDAVVTESVIYNANLMISNDF